jgi:urease accessory protein UreF
VWGRRNCKNSVRFATSAPCNATSTPSKPAKAHGWHTLVYGLTLALYSLPLRQGLLGYAHQTTRGFIHAAARSLRLTEADCRALFEELCAPLPIAIEALVSKLAAA